MDRESFLFYRTYQEAGHRIPEKQRLKFYEMIFEYGLTGEEPNDTGDALIDMALSFIRPLIRANIRNYENGSKGGAPAGNQNARKTYNLVIDAVKLGICTDEVYVILVMLIYGEKEN